MADHLWVGIDGGGTRTRAVAIDADGEVRARVEGAPGLIDPVDPLAGAPELASLTRRTLDAAGESGLAAGLCCALAGAGRADVRTALSLELSHMGIAADVIVIGDAEAAMYDAFRGEPGVLLIAGTGSVAWAGSADGSTARAGGWGTLLGDEGSGYAIGLAGLSAVVRAADGREPPTTLTAALLNVTGLRSPDELIAWTAAASKSDVARLAPAVLLEATSGDVCAAAIAEEAGRELVEQVHAVIVKSGPWTGDVPIAFAGGLIAPGGPLRDTAVRALEQLEDRTFKLRDEPVDAARGAALIARNKTRP